MRKNSCCKPILITALFIGAIITFSRKYIASTIDSVLYGDISILVNDPQQYGDFKYFKGYSGLDIFPEDISLHTIEDYYYSYEDTLFDPTSQIYLCCSYDKKTYEEEIERLSKISKSYKGKNQQVIYDTEHYSAPAYVTIDANDHCYEYALLAGENKIVYIFLQFIKEENIAFDSKYLPENYENAVTDEERGYSIYLFYERNGDGTYIY